ncbi:MAG: ATP-binding domain-containing protein, partial [Verrucomicrobia bacterium]|nr:ATP-binding domain-containing protein [Verrucomicrobiota bacterium]
EKFYPEVKVIKLEQNYRSTNIILKAATKVIQKNVRRREKNLWSEQETGELIKLATYDNAEDEAQGVVDQIEMDRVNGVPWQKQAILFRTNQQSRPIEMALRKKQIRYNLVGGQSFFDRSEIRDFLAYTKTLINPNDDINLLRIANTPPRGLSDVTMERLLGISQEHHKSVFGVMEDGKLIEHFLSRIQLSIKNFHELITSTRNMLMASPVGFPLNDWLDEFLDDQGLYNYIRRVEKTAEAGDMKISNIRQMLKDLEPHTIKHSPMEALQEFLEEITLDNEFAEEKQKENAITLITMHSCKGLEYPYVHIVGLEEGILPHSRSKTEGTLDEERRLFYVAITRAKEVLYLSHCTGRKQYGQLMPCHPSQFLMEIPEELMERSDVIMRTVPTQEAAQNIFADIFSQIG